MIMVRLMKRIGSIGKFDGEEMGSVLTVSIGFGFDGRRQKEKKKAQRRRIRIGSGRRL